MLRWGAVAVLARAEDHCIAPSTSDRILQMLRTIFYIAAALSVAGVICATAAAVVAEHFRRAEKHRLVEDTGPAEGGISSRQFALSYGVFAIKLSGIFAVVAGAAYLAA